MQSSFLKRALHESDSQQPKRPRKKVTFVEHCTLYGTFVSGARSARNIKFTIAPLLTQTGLGGKTNGLNAYREGDILMLLDGDDYAPVCNLAEETFSATQFVRGEYDIDINFGDIVKTTVGTIPTFGTGAFSCSVNNGALRVRISKRL